MRFVLSLAVAAVAAAAAPAADPAPTGKNKRLLLVTHSLGFIHDSVGVAEDTLKEIGPKNGFDVTCWRFTGDPDKKVPAAKKKGADVSRDDYVFKNFDPRKNYTQADSDAL